MAAGGIGAITDEAALRAFVQGIVAEGDMAAKIRQLQGRVKGQVVTSLPADPFDGQEVVYLASEPSGIVWKLRYRRDSGSAFKWEVVGGSPLRSGDGATQSTASNVFQTLGTPSVTVPLAGDYDIEWGTPAVINTVAAVNQMELGMHINGASWLTSYLIASGQWDGGTLHERNTFAFMPAGAVLNPRYRSLNSQTCNWLGFYLYAMPVRVG